MSTLKKQKLSSSLLDFSFDILQHIFKLADPESLKAMRLVCPELRCLVEAEIRARVYDGENYPLKICLSLLLRKHFILQRPGLSPRNSAKFSSDGNKIVTAGYNDVCVWSAKTGDLLSRLEGHKRDVIFAEFTPDDTHIISATSTDLRMWDAASGQCTISIPARSPLMNFQQCLGAKIFPGHKTDDLMIMFWCYSVSQNRTSFHVFEKENWRHFVVECCYINGPPVHSVQINSDGTKFAVILETKILVLKTEQFIRQHAIDLSSKPLSCHFSSDGSKITTLSSDGSLSSFDLVTGACIWSSVLQSVPKLGLGISPTSFKFGNFSPDGTKLVTGHYGKLRINACLWSVETGKFLTDYKGHKCTTSDANFSRDGSKIVTSSWDSTVRVWNVTQ